MSRLLIIASRVLRFFPAVILAFGIVTFGLSLREFFFQSADQFVTVHVAGRR